jgi:subtilisin-like proprotein convertase family protein
MKSLVVIVIGSLAIFGCSSGADVPDDAENPDEEGATELPPSAVEQIEELIAEKEARTPAQRKISSQLLYMKSGRFAASLAEKKDKKQQIVSLAEQDPAGRVLIDVKGDVSLEADIESLGGSVVGSSAIHRSVRAWLPLDRVETLAGESRVVSIRPAMLAATGRMDPPFGGAKFRAASRAERVAAVQRLQSSLRARSDGLARLASAAPTTNVGAATSEGSTAHGAERARKFFNSDGTGVTIGVLSDSDDFKEQSIATGDLPADTITIPGQSGRPGIGEGTAMMEIVHDVAPGASLVFATAFISPESFADNIRRLRFEFGCDIIVDDIIYFFESPYTDDIIAQAVRDVIADGAMYFSSAGNEGNFNDGTSGTWEGDFKSAGALASLPSGYAVHDFGNKVISNRIEGFNGPLFLHWSDFGTLDNPQSSNDYDLFLLDFDLRNVVLASTDIQDGTGLPLEFLGFIIPPDFRIVIAQKAGAQKRTVRVMQFRGELGIATNGATYGHSQVFGAFATAAVDAFEAGGGEFVEGALTPVEIFSGDGPRRVFYNPDGSPISGGVSGNGGQLRQKPDIAGADGVSTTLPPFSGLNPFFGTSAAAPHAAAIAALIKAAVPTATPSRIRTAMLNGALDIEAAGVDRDSGRGIVSAFNGLAGAGARPAAFLELAGITATPVGSDAILPGGSATISATVANNGGASAAIVRGTLSSSSPYVTITQGSSNFPNLAPGASGSNATAFAFTLAADAPCGEVLAFSLSLSFSGRGTNPTVRGFSVQTGRLGDAVSTSYAGAPAAIPDSDPVGVDIPLEVTGASGSVAAVSFRIDGATCNADIGSTTVGVDHTWVGDLIFNLTSPSGRTVTVINQAGGAFNSGNNFCQTVLDDDAANSIQNVLVADAPYTGTFSPANPQAGFVGDAGNGTWNLNVSDAAFFDTGSVRAFSIDISGFDCTPAP